MKKVKFIIMLFSNILNVLGIWFFQLLFGTLIVVGLEWLCLSYIWKHVQNAIGVIVLLYLLSMFILLLVGVVIEWLLLKVTIRDLCKSATDLKRACWDNLSGEFANFIARVLRKDKEFE
jgi:hypothetical protein